MPAATARIDGALPNGTTASVVFDAPDAGFQVLVWLDEKCGGAPDDSAAWKRGLEARDAEIKRMERARREGSGSNAGS